MSLLKYTASSLGFNTFPSFPSSNFFFLSVFLCFLCVHLFILFHSTQQSSGHYNRSVISNVVLFNCFLFIQHFSLVQEVHHVSWNRCSSLNCFRCCCCSLLFVTFDDNCLSADRLHIDRRVVLAAVAGVVVLAVVAVLVVFIFLSSPGLHRMSGAFL